MPSVFDQNQAIGRIGESFVVSQLRHEENIRRSNGTGRDGWALIDVSQKSQWFGLCVDVVEAWVEDGKEVQVWHEIKTDQNTLMFRHNAWEDVERLPHWDNYDFLAGVFNPAKGTGKLFLEKKQNPRSIEDDGWMRKIEKIDPLEHPPAIRRELWFYLRAAVRTIEKSHSLVLRIEDKVLLKEFHRRNNTSPYPTHRAESTGSQGWAMPVAHLWKCPRKLRKWCEKHSQGYSPVKTAPIWDRSAWNDSLQRRVPLKIDTQATLYTDYKRLYERGLEGMRMAT